MMPFINIEVERKANKVYWAFLLANTASQPLPCSVNNLMACPLTCMCHMEGLFIDDNNCQSRSTLMKNPVRNFQ